MAIGHEGDDGAERRGEANTPVGAVCPADLDAGRLRIVAGDGAAGELDEAPDERIGAVGRQVDAVFGNGLQLGVPRRGRVPVELHVDAARPLDDGVAADRVVERGNGDVGATRARCADGGIHIRHEVARSLESERIWNRCLEAEHRQRADRCEDELVHRAARRRRHREDTLLGRGSTERRQKARDESIEVFRGDVDVGRVVLRSYGHGRRTRGRTRFPPGVRRARDEQHRKSESADHPHVSAPGHTAQQAQPSAPQRHVKSWTWPAWACPGAKTVRRIAAVVLDGSRSAGAA